MKPMNDRTKLGRPPTEGQPATRQRFRIEKLEERIAPRRGGRNATNKCDDTLGCTRSRGCS